MFTRQQLLNDYGTPAGEEHHVLKACKSKHILAHSHTPFRLTCTLYRDKPELISEMLNHPNGPPIAWKWRYIEHKDGNPATLGLTFYTAKPDDSPSVGPNRPLVEPVEAISDPHPLP